MYPPSVQTLKMDTALSKYNFALFIYANKGMNKLKIALKFMYYLLACKDLFKQ